MRYNLKKTSLVTLTACMALACHVNAQEQKINFQIKDPVPVTNQGGQKILLDGMQGNSVSFKFANNPNAGASIPVDPDSRVRLTYAYPDNFSDIQFQVLNGSYDQALRAIRKPPINLLHFLAVPEPNCNFHLYGEIYYRALVYAGAPQVAVEATTAIPWNSPYLPPVFIDHAGILLNRMVNEEEIEATGMLLATLESGLSVTQFSNLALPVADKLRLLGESKLVDSIYNALSQSSDENMRKLGKLWTTYNLANTGKTEEAKSLLDQMGEIAEGSPFFSVYCLAQGRLALSEENSVQALRYLSRAMVRTTIADSYKPEIYFLMIQSYMMDKDKVPASRLAKEMAVFYPNNMWRKSIINRFPEIEQAEIN